MSQSVSQALGLAISIKKGRKHEISAVPSNDAKRLIGIDDLRNDDLIRFTNDPTGVEVEPDDVLIAWDGANAGTIGHGKQGFIGSTIARLRIKNRKVLFPKFLSIYLKSKFEYLRQTATGATIPHINRNALESIPLPSISFNDQIRIAHLLGKVEGLIAQRKQHLQQFDELLRSVFLEMFGDPVWNEKGWDTKTLPQLVQPGKNSLKRGPFGGALKKEIFVEAGYLVYEQNHALNNDYSFARYFVTEQKYQELIDFKVMPGDILISCSGVYLGKLSIVPANARPGIINQALLKVSLDPKKIKHRFFVYVFGSPQFKEKYFPSNRGGAIPNLPPMSVMKKIPFIYPPVTLQQDFTDFCEKVEALKSHYQQSFADLETLYAALSQSAFQGELDLSRIPLQAVTLEPELMENGSTVTAELDVPASPLPDLGLSAAELADEAKRLTLLTAWLEAWRTAHAGRAFVPADFLDAAQVRLAKLYSDDELELSMAAYEHIKNWVYAALDSGALTQSYDEANKCITLTVTRA